jgi:hypothetical protein
VLHPDAPAESKANGGHALDLPEKIGEYKRSPSVAGHPTTLPAWHGTILPKGDGDIWLASAFAQFEGIAATERKYREEGGGHLNPQQRLRLALDRNGFRTGCAAAGSLADIKPTAESDDWYRQASGKGVLVLHELRRLLTDKVFDKAMDDFGTKHAGKPVTTDEFREHLEKASGKKLGEFFDAWVKGNDWIEFDLTDVQVKSPAKAPEPFHVSGAVKRKGPACEAVTVTVEFEGDERSEEVKFQGGEAKFNISVPKAPSRVVVDKYLEHARPGPASSVRAFWSNLPETLIVYGTRDEAAANLDAAQEMQKSIRSSSANHTVPIKSDREATDADLEGKHVILIGRPDANALTQRFADEMPVRFGWRCLRAAGDTFAHPLSGAIAAATNPLSPKHSLIVVAGLSAAGTRSAATRFTGETHAAADAVVLPYGMGAYPLLAPGAKLSRELK